jgi:DNA-binding CsgD family transcriptional regulator
MPLSKTKLDEVEERRSKVWQLRIKGMSVREIGRQLGINKSTVFNDLEAVRVEVADETKDAALRYRELELGRLDDLYAIAVDRVQKIQERLDRATDDENKDGLNNSLSALVNSLRGLSERRAKLLGLDGPVEFKGSVDGELSPEAIRLAIAREFSSRATPTVTNDSSTAPEPQRADSAAGDPEVSS